LVLPGDEDQGCQQSHQKRSDSHISIAPLGYNKKGGLL